MSKKLTSFDYLEQMYRIEKEYKEKLYAEYKEMTDDELFNIIVMSSNYSSGGVCIHNLRGQAERETAISELARRKRKAAK